MLVYFLLVRRLTLSKSRLIQAAENLEERLPIYAQLEAERHNNATLKARIEELEQGLLVSHENCSDIERQREDALHKCQVLFHDAKRRIDREQAQKDLFCQKAKHQKKEMEREIARLTSLCLEQEKQVCVTIIPLIVQLTTTGVDKTGEEEIQSSGPTVLSPTCRRQR